MSDRTRALHAAGHTVAAFLRGLPLLGVSLDEDELGCPTHEPSDALRTMHPGEAFMVAAHAITTLEAGKVADGSSHGDELVPEDIERAAAWAEFVTSDPREALVFLAWPRARAHHLVADAWHLVEGLAEHLLVVRRLTTEGVREWLDAATSVPEA